MQTFLLILAIHGLLLGLGFLFAGYMTLLGAEEQEQVQFRKEYLEARRVGFFKGWAKQREFRRNFTSGARLSKNWAERPAARKCIYAGIALLAFAAVLGVPLGAYK